MTTHDEKHITYTLIKGNKRFTLLLMKERVRPTSMTSPLVSKIFMEEM